MTDTTEVRIDTDENERPKAPVELRTAQIGEVNFAQRIVTLVAVPYEQPAAVMWKGEVWTEQFERSAWDGIEKRPSRIKVNRDHNKSRTVGRALKFFPSRQEGLVTELRIAQTALGDETLTLCDERCLGASVGFAALPSDQIIDRSARSRRIKRGFLDHISLVEDPAYSGTEAMDIRQNEIIIPDENMPELPQGRSIDDWMNDPVLTWAKNYTTK